MRQEILEIIIKSVESLNNTLDFKLPIEQVESCPLYGDNSPLDSISLVTLIVTVEQDIEDQFDVPIIIANEKAMSHRSSPFLTVGALTNYALELVEESKHG